MTATHATNPDNPLANARSFDDVAADLGYTEAFALSPALLAEIVWNAVAADAFPSTTPPTRPIAGRAVQRYLDRILPSHMEDVRGTRELRDATTALLVDRFDAGYVPSL